MREQHLSNNALVGSLAAAPLIRPPWHSRPASCGWSRRDVAQTTMPGMQPSSGMLATSPLNPQSTRPLAFRWDRPKSQRRASRRLIRRKVRRVVPDPAIPHRLEPCSTAAGCPGAHQPIATATARRRHPCPRHRRSDASGFRSEPPRSAAPEISPTVPCPAPPQRISTTSINGSGNP